MTMTREQRLETALRDLLKAYDMLMPGIRYIAVPDYALINEAPINARKALDREFPSGTCDVHTGPHSYFRLPGPVSPACVNWKKETI
jgi:hypothetical protein